MSQPDEQQKPGQPQPPSSDLGAELRDLGQQIEQALRGAVESERARQIQRDIASGMKEIGAQVQTAIKAIQNDPRVQDLAERGQQAVDKARESKAANDFQESLARGIAQLNDQLATFVQRLQTSDTAAANTPPAADPPPTTGETTRLDIDEK